MPPQVQLLRVDCPFRGGNHRITKESFPSGTILITLTLIRLGSEAAEKANWNKFFAELPQTDLPQPGEESDDTHLFWMDGEVVAGQISAKDVWGTTRKLGRWDCTTGLDITRHYRQEGSRIFKSSASGKVTPCQWICSLNVNDDGRIHPESLAIWEKAEELGKEIKDLIAEELATTARNPSQENTHPQVASPANEPGMDIQTMYPNPSPTVQMNPNPAAVAVPLQPCNMQDMMSQQMIVQPVPGGVRYISTLGNGMVVCQDCFLKPGAGPADVTGQLDQVKEARTCSASSTASHVSGDVSGDERIFDGSPSEADEDGEEVGEVNDHEKTASSSLSDASTHTGSSASGVRCQP